MRLAHKLAGGYTTNSPKNEGMAENRGANLQRCGDQNHLLFATAMSRRIVPWSSACQCPPFPAQEGGKNGHFQKTRYKSCILRGSRAFIPIESAGQCLALTQWNDAVSGLRSPAGDDVSCAAVAVCVGGVSLPEHDCASYRYWDRESAGMADVQGPVLMACLWYFVSSTGDSMQYELSCICSQH